MTTTAQSSNDDTMCVCVADCDAQYRFDMTVNKNLHPLKSCTALKATKSTEEFQRGLMVPAGMRWTKLGTSARRVLAL